MFKLRIIALFLLAASSFVNASPELLLPTEAVNEQFELIETVEVTGDINDSLQRLVDSSLAGKTNEFYVIKDISEDISKDTLTVVIGLYRQPSNSLSTAMNLI
ncbi:hypothetical protein L4D09_12655 [Photobacterium makurazakiensis]|uniref:hypothetical protein n=1 Tax=Photobacterium makurazakiensis TaxID=2910234 RepID=UPI003D1433CC